MPLSPQWQLFARRLVALVGPLVNGWVIAGVAGVIGLSPGWVYWLTAYAFLSVATTGVLCKAWAPTSALAGILISALMANIGLLEAVPLTVLAERGRPAVATVVTDERVTYYGKDGMTYEWRYTLETSEGGPIAGHLVEKQDWLDVGDQVRVVYDPAGLADPRLPEELQDRSFFWMLAEVSALLAMLGALALAAWAVSEERVARWQDKRWKSKPVKTWFRPLGRRRRIIGRTWLGLGVATMIGGGITRATHPDSWVGALGVLVALIGAYVAVLSVTAAFGRDTRTE